jgi:hypothetical protein
MLLEMPFCNVILRIRYNRTRHFLGGATYWTRPSHLINPHATTTAAQSPEHVVLGVLQCNDIVVPRNSLVCIKLLSMSAFIIFLQYQSHQSQPTTTTTHFKSTPSKKQLIYYHELCSTTPEPNPRRHLRWSLPRSAIRTRLRSPLRSRKGNSILLH